MALSTTYNNQPIGVFDSGVGGLSIAKSVAELLPNESFIYLADSLNAPYGDLTSEQIIKRVNKIAQWFIAKNVKVLMIACNTATVNAIDQLRTHINIPVIGVEPAIKPAVIQSKTKNIALMVTQATATNNRFIRLVNKHKQSANVHIQPCPGLVEIIEKGQIEGVSCHALLQQYLAPLIHSTIDTLVLGCTHYPFLSDKIKVLLGDNIALIETSTPVAKQLQKQLISHRLIASPQSTSQHLFFSTQANEQQNKIFSHLWKKSIIVEKETI